MHIIKQLLLVALLSFLGTASLSCNKPGDNSGQEEQTEEETVDPNLEPLKAKIMVNENWIFESKPEVIFVVTNPNDKAVSAKFKLRIITDKGADVETVEQSIKVDGGGKKISISPKNTLAPGYYYACCYFNGTYIKKFCFGISPFKIVSAPDKQSDFDDFWQAAKDQLEGVEMNATLTEITSRSTSAQKVYLVEMQSVPDGLDGEPVTVRGYYLEPTDGQKHPVLLHFYGYDTQKNPSSLSCPYGSSAPQYAEFYLSHRGQYINNRAAGNRTYDGKGDFENIYGDWFAYQFGNKDAYYYRGAFMDCVQAVRFMATRPTSDMNNLFAEGSSQGGALSYAVAALSDYPFTAIAPCVAFLGDYPDYFQIVSWPGDTARKNKGSMTDEQMYAFLSYFDTKNLATRISCAVIACSGLQDGTCPPHTNIAPYNNLLSTDKEFHFYPEMKHEIPLDWTSKYTKFFKARIK